MGRSSRASEDRVWWSQKRDRLRQLWQKDGATSEDNGCCGTARAETACDSAKHDVVTGEGQRLDSIIILCSY